MTSRDRIVVRASRPARMCLEERKAGLETRTAADPPLARNGARPIWADGSRSTQPRQGSILLLAMVCILVMTTLFGALLQAANATRAQLRREAHRSQARWLAESGAGRAAAALAANKDYRGETWEVPASELGGDDPGWVLISVTAGDSPAIEVRADFPVEGPDRVRYEHTWPMAIKPKQ